MERKKYERKKRTFVKHMLAVILSFCMVFGMASFVGPIEVQAAGNPSWNSSAYNGSNPFAQSGYYGQCTWYAWGRAYEVMGKSLPCRGHGGTWYNNARDNGWSVGSEPRANSIAVWSGGSYGHVAYVESVSGGSVTISEANYRTNYLDDQCWSLSDGIKYYDGTRTLTNGQMQYRNGSLLGYIYLGQNDTIPPTISDFHVGELRTEGFTVMAKVTDANGISAVRYAIWTEKDGWDDLRWYDGNCTDGNDYYWARINFSDHKNRKGKYIIHMYAYDLAGNETGSGIDYTFPEQGPSISDVAVSDITSSGYTVTCKVINDIGISKVQFPTWTVANDQDDLAQSWWDNPGCRGTQNGTTWSFRVNDKDHNFERGIYRTHIYAYDIIGNATCYELNNIEIQNTYSHVNTVSYNGHTYNLYNDILTWDEAKAACEELGGHLVTITSVNEQKAVAELIRGQARRGYWIGGSSDNGSTWVNGEEFSFSNWEPGEPNAEGGEDSYGIYTGSGTWNDWLGSNRFLGLGFICEWDGMEAEKPNNSDNLDNPNTPDNPDDSDTSDNSDKPDKPDAPENPDNSDQTDSLDDPETQDKPGNSDDTDNSKKLTVSKVKSFKATAGKKKLTLSWKKLSGAAGYQIQISTKKNFKGAKTISISKSKKTCTKKSLKAKKKYYIRIRAYKTYKDVNKKTKKVYGKWTTINKRTK